MLNARDRLIIALDVATLEEARNIIIATKMDCSTYKVGLELYLKYGHKSVELVQSYGAEVFLDLKLHDIPNTVHRALLQLLPLKPKFLTLHASGGHEMLMAAKEALSTSQGSNPKTMLLAVSVLTNLSKDNLKSLGILGEAHEVAAKWLSPIKDETCFGAVCSPHEASHLKTHLGPHFQLVCPGVRPKSANKNDQTRIATPQQALHNGADYIVIGRPITAANNPTIATRSIIDEIEGASKTAQHQQECYAQQNR